MAEPVWMYRKGEAKLFVSPEDVPKGEGWKDSPSPSDEEEQPTEPQADDDQST